MYTTESETRRLREEVLTVSIESKHVRKNAAAIYCSGLERTVNGVGQGDYPAVIDGVVQTVHGAVFA